MTETVKGCPTYVGQPFLEQSQPCSKIFPFLCFLSVVYCLWTKRQNKDKR